MSIEAQQVVTPLAAMKQALEALELTDNDAVYGLYRDEKRQVIEAITSLRQAIAEAEKQEPDDLTIAYMSGLYDGKKQRQQERNFCERCGKQLGKNEWDIHTCTPPTDAEKHEVSQEPVAVERFKWIFEDKYGNRFTQAEVYYTEREAQESAKICGNKSIGKASESPIICWDMRESSPPQRQHEPCPYVLSTKEGTHHCSLSQRQPLTDERIWLEYMHLWPFRPNDEPTLAKDIVKFARAIEAAHGIGEKK